MKSFDSLVEKYVTLRNLKDAVGLEIANKIKEIVEKYIPDISCNEAMCFFSDKRDKDASYKNGKGYYWTERLDDVINRVFPGLKARCHLGVYMTEEEAKNLENDLKHLKESLIMIKVKKER